MSAPLVLMMAGGTGGHVYPALAVAKELLARGCRVEWIGTDRGLEAQVVPDANIKLHRLMVRGLRGKNLIIIKLPTTRQTNGIGKVQKPSQT